jgi:hypothetical protein
MAWSYDDLQEKMYGNSDVWENNSSDNSALTASVESSISVLNNAPHLK